MISMHYARKHTFEEDVRMTFLSEDHLFCQQVYRKQEKTTTVPNVCVCVLIEKDMKEE